MTVTLPASGADVRQLANAVTVAVAFAETLNGAAAPLQVTVPSVDLELIMAVVGARREPRDRSEVDRDRAVGAAQRSRRC